MVVRLNLVSYSRDIANPDLDRFLSAWSHHHCPRPNLFASWASFRGGHDSSALSYVHNCWNLFLLHSSNLFAPQRRHCHCNSLSSDHFDRAPVWLYITFVLKLTRGFEANARDDTNKNIKEFYATRNVIPLLLIFYYHVVELVLMSGYKPELAKEIQHFTQKEKTSEYYKGYSKIKFT